MEKKSKIIFIIVTTIISLLVIVAMYYGIDRFIRLRLCSDKNAKKLIENYSKLPQATDNRTVITFASQDGHNIIPTVMSILDQTVSVNQIALNSCLKNNPPDICMQAINVFRVSPNTEQFQGIIPTLEREKEATTNIIWLRDDYIYSKDFIENLFEAQKNPTQAVIAKNSKDEIIGILLKPDSLKTEIIDYKKSCTQENNKNDCNSIQKIQNYLNEKPEVIISADSYKI